MENTDTINYYISTYRGMILQNNILAQKIVMHYVILFKKEKKTGRERTGDFEIIRLNTHCWMDRVSCAGIKSSERELHQ